MSVSFVFAFLSCDQATGDNNSGPDYVLTADGFKAEISGNEITFTLTDPSDDSLVDISTINGVTNVTEGLKGFFSVKPSDTNYELIYAFKSGTTTTQRAGLQYINKSGSATEDGTVLTFSDGAGWYIGDTTFIKLTAANNYSPPLSSPSSSTYKWMVRRKDNGNIVWEQ
jgi:hypothetical protein